MVKGILKTGVSVDVIVTVSDFTKEHIHDIQLLTLRILAIQHLALKL
jgi:hypothetical protein